MTAVQLRHPGTIPAPSDARAAVRKARRSLHALSSQIENAKETAKDCRDVARQAAARRAELEVAVLGDVAAPSDVRAWSEAVAQEKTARGSLLSALGALKNFKRAEKRCLGELDTATEDLLLALERGL